MRGVTLHRFRYRMYRKFLLTRLMRGVTKGRDTIQDEDFISTHTPHARRDNGSELLF